MNFQLAQHNNQIMVTIVDNTMGACLLCDAAHSILYANSMATVLLQDAAVLVGQKLCEVFAGFSKCEEAQNIQDSSPINSFAFPQKDSCVLTLYGKRNGKDCKYLLWTLQVSFEQQDFVLVCFKEVPIVNSPSSTEACIEKKYYQEQLDELKRLNEKLRIENTERRAVGRALLRAESRYRDIFDNAVEAIFQWNSSWQLLSANRSCAAMFGYATVNEMMDHTSFGGFAMCYDSNECARLVAELESKGGVSNFEFQLRTKGGQFLWVNLNARRVPGILDRASYYEGFMEDISERYDAKKKLEYQAFHDPLTGLANRALFTDHLQMSLNRFSRNKSQRFAVLFLDLDRFKMVNDTYGHAAGDLVLRHAGNAIHSCVRDHDTVARFGGDEFGVILEGFENADFVITVVERMRDALTAPLYIGEHSIHFGVSIGIVISDDKYMNIDDVLRDADTAMYKAKGELGHYYQIFNGELEAESVAKLKMHMDLRLAEKDGDFEIYFQPIVSLATHKTEALEAILIWKRGDELVLPRGYMPVAESIGMSGRLNVIRLHKIFTQMVAWSKIYSKPVQIYTRITWKQFLQPDFIPQLNDLINATGVNPKNLHFEIHDREIIFPKGDSTARETIEQLHSLGIKLCLGNFGGSVPSLAILQNLPVSALKIYREIIEKSLVDKRGLAIIRGLALLGHECGLQLILDGFEGEKHFALLGQVEYCYGQGNYFSPLVMAKDVEKYLS